MQYLGGKSRIAKDIAAQIRPFLRGRPVWDPFCGGLSISAEFGGGLASDICEPLINLYLAVQNGWMPPERVTVEEYSAAKTLPDTDPRKAFCGFGCSFGGKWFGGYLSQNPKRSMQTYAASARKALLRDVPKVKKFACLDFLMMSPRPVPFAIYCDPPYRGTTEYRTTFQHDIFFERLAAWAKYNDVWVSEYNLPFGDCVWERPCGLQMLGGHRVGARTERLYKI